MQNPIVKYIQQNHFLATVLVVGTAFFLLQVKEILLVVFLSFIIMSSLNPAILWLRARRIPKVIAIMSVYLLVTAFIVLLVVPILPFFVSQIEALIKAIPAYVDTASRALGIEFNKAEINSLVNPAVGFIGHNAFSFTSKIFGSLFSLLTIFILSFYLLVDHDRFEKTVPSLFSDKNQQKARETLALVEDKLGAWLRGQVVLSLTLGAITWVMLTFLHIPFALPLAILAGFLEIIPTLGPIISAVPAVIVGLAISPVMAATVTVAYTVIQLSENHILVPKIMQKAVGLNPVVIIVAILIGGHLLGIMGALLSIPFVSAAIIIFRAFK